jgi:hypothetical protein
VQEVILSSSNVSRRYVGNCAMQWGGSQVMTRMEIKYTTPDGVEHVETVDVAMHPIISVEAVSIDGVSIPLDKIRVFEEDL